MEEHKIKEAVYEARIEVIKMQNENYIKSLLGNLLRPDGTYSADDLLTAAVKISDDRASEILTRVLSKLL